MGGAPITITLYKNGIHITYSNPLFFTHPGFEKKLRAMFDAGQDINDWLWKNPKPDLLKFVDVAIDTVYAADRRDETFSQPPVAAVF